MILRLAGALLGLFMAGLPAAAADFDDPRRVYLALDRSADAVVESGGGRIRVVFADGARGLDRDRVLTWVQRAAGAVTTYFGRFPVDDVGLLVIADGGDRVMTGTTFGFGGSAIRVIVGRDTGDEAFARDWVLTHEMVHLALPQMDERFLWLLEGSAVYVEPVARALASQIAPESVWRDALTGMPRGEPEAGDRGLDHTPTWGRTYWGGAIFCLLADIAIRQQSAGRQSLRDAFTAINRASGGNTAYWSMEEIVAEGDRATGTGVLAALYAKMAAAPSPTDLPALFAALGVRLSDGGAVLFDDSAPLAPIRRAITAN
ncbi:hypothetical protein [Zavarzinia aquatilis]|uniref:Peptidase M61 catalytic domain-containing protein n=1 Tax=Zavarzinia aquatilis TaxID=2211142 RepID=A0A317E3A5_9PROT|nr:hypothetical protein [Zavarzinia aquatilis]PWR21469.1 hypothetical protein DKG74_13660 [Zavarzinia aquatilis]